MLTQPMLTQHRNRGFTLIELMVALVLGLVVVGGVMGVFMSTYQANSQNIKSVRLNEDMRAVMSLITRDIRRAGIRSFNWTATTVNWYATNVFAPTGMNWIVSAYSTTEPANSCILFNYDTNNNNALDIVDNRGYRLHKEGTAQSIEMRRTATACNGTGWEKITDENVMNVLSLDFTTTIEPGVAGVSVRSIIVTLRGATNTRSGNPATITAADCSNIDVVCPQLVEKIRLRNDAVL
jgi:prepilin-type N-terminal cleavage/methylation domain-containing protein